MTYRYFYQTPEAFSDLWMESDGNVLTGLWFDGSRDSEKHNLNCEEKLLRVFEETIRWLDIYFSGRDPGFIPEYKLNNVTSFRRVVSDLMLEIPFGETRTYGDLAKRIASDRGMKKMSAQAVGGAVGWNPIVIIIPCHRVMGAGNNLTGYGGGLKNKEALLRLERQGKKYKNFPKVNSDLV